MNTRRHQDQRQLRDRSSPQRELSCNHRPFGRGLMYANVAAKADCRPRATTHVSPDEPAGAKLLAHGRSGCAA